MGVNKETNDFIYQPWIDISSAFYSEASNLRVFKELWKEATKKEKFFIGLSMFSFIFFLVFYFSSVDGYCSYFLCGFYIHYSFLIIAVVFELIFLIFFDKVVKRRFNNSMKFDTSNMMYEGRQRSRYDLFSYKLRTIGIDKVALLESLSILNCLQETEKEKPKLLNPWTLIFFGLIAATLSNFFKEIVISSSVLIVILLSLSIVISFSYFYARLFPSNLFILKEFEFFIKLYLAFLESSKEVQSPKQEI